MLRLFTELAIREEREKKCAEKAKARTCDRDYSITGLGGLLTYLYVVDGSVSFLPLKTSTIS
jgi:hypothetical protein